MPVSISSNAPSNMPNADAVSQSAKSASASSTQATARAQLNVSIVQASLSVSISSQNEPMTLLFKSAIDSLNEALKPTLGENAIQNAVNQDNTPEGTAGRIVSLSTGFFDAFKKQHADLSNADALKQFMATIRSGFEQGFKEASNILQGLKVLNGDIADNVNKTYDLVQKGYADFEASQSSATATAADAGSAQKA